MSRYRPHPTVRPPAGWLALLLLLAGPWAAWASDLTCRAAPAPTPPAAATAPADPISRAELITVAQAARARGIPHTELEGWLQLIDIAAAAERGAPQTEQALQEWQMRYPRHPALPYAARVQRAALGEGTVLALLPLSGNYGAVGEVVARGLLGELGTDQVELMDVGSGALPIQRIAAALQRQHPQLIVGPLIKEQTAELAAREPPVVTLALNAFTGELPPHFHTFALTPEQEGRALAERVMVEIGSGCGIAVADPADHWQRLVASFRQRLVELGGCLREVRTTAPARGDYAYLLLARASSAGVPHGLVDPPVYAPLRAKIGGGIRLVGPALAVGRRPREVDDRLLLHAFGRDAGRIARAYLRSGSANQVAGETGELTLRPGGVQRALTMLRLEGGKLVAEGCP